MALRGWMRRTLRWSAYAVLALVVVVVAGYALLQTSPGLNWASRTLANLASTPGFSVSITGLGGAIPFDIRAERIEVSDAKGAWLRIDNAQVDVLAAALIARRAEIGTLGAAKIELMRLPEPSGPPPPSIPLSEKLQIPRLPLPLTVTRLAVGRLVLDAPVVGEAIEAALDGHVAQTGYDTDVALNLHRTDGKPGAFELQLSERGADPVLSLALAASEPTGVVLNRVLNRTDNLPLGLSLKGEGPLAQWQGRLEVAAGTLAHAGADVRLAATRDTVVSLDGTAAMAGLLPPDLAKSVGDPVPIEASVTLKEDGAIALDRLSLRAAAGTLTADARLGGAARDLSGHIRLDLPQLSAVGASFGPPLQGAAVLNIMVSGSEDRPRLLFDGVASGLKAAQSGADRVEAHLDVQWPEHPGDLSAQIALLAHGAITGIALPDTARELGRDLTWSIDGQAAPDGSTAELTRLAAHGAGVDVEGAGRMAQMGRVLSGKVHASIADLRPLTSMIGRPIAGELKFDATAEQQSPDLVTATLDGSLDKLQAGIPAADALAGGALAIGSTAHRGADGVVVLDAFSIKGVGADLTASGRLDPASRQISATLDAVIASLQPVGKELGTRLAGRLAAHVTADGPLDQPQVQAHLDATSLAAGTAALDNLRLDARIANPSQPLVSLTGDFRGGGLDGTFGVEGQLGDHSDLTLRQLRVKAAGGAIDGDLHIDLASLLASGTLSVRLPDLAPWSRLAGMPLGGRLDLQAKLAEQRGQSVELTVNAEGLATGGGSGRIAVGHLSANARIADALGAPSGSGQATLASVTGGFGNIAKASLNLDSAGPGRFGFRADASGNLHAPLTVAMNGTASITPRTGAFDLQLARLNGTIGAEKFQLTRALTLSAHGNDLAMSGLDLTLGRGQISGDASRRGGALSLQVKAHDLDLAALGHLAGQSGAGGTLGLDASVSGTLGSPQGRFSVTGRNLRFALPKQRLPTLGLDLSGTWNGRELGFNGHVSGLKGDALTITGEAPLVLTQSPFGVSVPPQGRLALRLQGAGEIGNIADLLPLGEDTVSGHFALDGGVTGTLAAPAASGHLTITDGRYANFATGAVLSHLRVDVSGDRDRVTVREFSANDTGSGTISGRGSVVLAGAAPAADVTVTLNNFRMLGRDEVVLTGSGNVLISGSLAAPKVTAQLTTGQGDLRIPDSLPPSVTKLQVVEINSRAPPKRPPPRGAARGGAPPPGPTNVSPPAVAAALDIKISLPGQVFVRGHGLDSEWRGKLAITGASDAPQIRGSLEAVRGTFDILGKTFKVTRGVISFDGAKTIDPTLDIVTEVAAGDIVAQVLVTGSASAPKIAMSSSPTMPQEQILSYVLFNRTTTQITAAEGIQVAQAAATLSGGGSGMLDKLRGGLGLDRLMLGSSQTGNASSSLNPAAGGSNATGTSVSGGKYVAEGVYVGATQGLTPQSSKVVVEVEVRPRVTVQGDFSQAGGSGLGLNYKYDY